MKILFLNTTDKTGGAAIAASRLKQALTKEGVDVSFLVKEKKGDDDRVFSCGNTKLRRFLLFLSFVWERVVIFINNRRNRSQLFKVSLANTGVSIINHPLVKEADIIHLHWVNQGFLSLRTIRKLSRLGKPVVWTMHDMWPCTSICHHAYQCARFKESCGRCPFLDSLSERDLSYRVWKKKRFMRTSAIHLVAVSSWLRGLSLQSSITKELAHSVIPNVLDTSLFRPGKREGLREALGLPTDKKIVLAGAVRLDDPIKGIARLLVSFNFVSEEVKKDCVVVLFGEIKETDFFGDSMPVSYITLGLLDNVEQIVRLYQAADVVVVPSRYETFGQTIAEAMACGCPVVSFDNSGQTDIIDHKVNGYLAKFEDTKELAGGIEWVLSHPDREALSKACLEKVETHYAERVVAGQYIDLYKRLLKE